MTAIIPKLFFGLLVPETAPDVVPCVLCEKATIHFVAPGTSILEKLHSLVKYFGTNLELKLLEFAVTVAFDLDPESKVKYVANEVTFFLIFACSESSKVFQR